MANLFIEGFDQYPTGLLRSVPGTPWLGIADFDVSTSDVITGSRSLVMKDSTGSRSFYRSISPSTNEVWMGIAIVPTTTGIANHRIGVHGSSESFGFRITNEMKLRAMRGSTTLQTSAGQHFNLGVKSYVELHATGTSYEILVDGVPVLSGTMTSIGTISRMTFLNDPVGSNSAVAYVDDIYVNDASGTRNNGFLGEVSVVALFPDADETPQDWTPSTGTDGYAILDNVPPTSAYIEASTALDESRFSFPDFPFSVTDIHVVGVVYHGQKSASGTSTVKATLHNGGSSTDGVANPLTEATWNYYSESFEVDPATGDDWDPDTFNPELSLTRTE